MSLVFVLAVSANYAHCVIFRCHFKDASHNWVENSTLTFYECRATIINVGRDAFLFDVRGRHLNRRNNANVNFFWSGFGELKVLPWNLADFFPNLKAISLLKMNLERISSAQLRRFHDLEMLDLRGNKLKSLNGDLFKYNPNLRIIDFENNLIEHIGHDLLKGLTRLWYTNFQFNPCLKESNEYFVHAQVNPEKWPVLNEQLPIKCPPNKEQQTCIFPSCNLQLTAF